MRISAKERLSSSIRALLVIVWTYNLHRTELVETLSSPIMTETDRNQAQEIYNKAVELLARREYGYRELLRQLERRGFDNELSVECLDALAKQGLQSDQRYAESYANVRAQKGYGPRHIRAHLSERGVDSDWIQLAFEELAFDWEERLAEAHTKRFGKTPPADYAEQTKRMRFLAQRGFYEADIRKLFR